MTDSRLRLFAGVGIEIEYAIVDIDSLDVRPLADRVLLDRQGRPVLELERGEVCWSNELAAHVLEIKTNGPAMSPGTAAPAFAVAVSEINARLRDANAMLMPTAAHPWMDPKRDTVLWPHEQFDIYSAFDRIFDCRRHGWANLQSMHLNLPFQGDAEFARLHAAIRATLPLIPGIAASSPFLDGKYSGYLDGRMEVYRTNSASVPSIAGVVVPEPVADAAEYEAKIYAPIRRDIQKLDPAGTLEAIWLNARGAIARFDRGAIEIRVIDTQEHPGADAAIAEAVIQVVKALCEERWTDIGAVGGLDTETLARQLAASVADGEAARLVDPRLQACFGDAGGVANVGALWQRLAQELNLSPAAREHLAIVAVHGTLARRMLAAAGPRPGRPALAALVRRLCDCLASGTAFLP